MKRSFFPNKHGLTLFSRRGFTLLEITAVLLLIAIIATVVASRAMDNSAEVVGATEVVKGHLRFAQNRAMNSDVNWGINFSGTSYTLEEDGAAGSSALPGTGGPTHTLAKASVATTANPVVFNQWGNPGATPITVTVSIGADSRSFTIVPLPGFMP